MRILANVTLPLLAVIAVGAVATSGSSRPSVLAQEGELACINMTGDRMPPATRQSPLDSVRFEIQGAPVMICYGRPSARGRAIMGGLLPFGSLWRTGANEPTMIHSSVALDIAGIEVEPGTYSLYTVPGESEWELIVNRSITQWGHEGRYTDEVRAQEVGRVKVASESTDEHVETFTTRALPSSDGNATVLLEWERTRVKIPIKSAAR